MIKGIIFDMDGTLLDTESILIQCWIESAASYGFDMQMKHALTIRSLQYRFAEPYLKRVFGETFCYHQIREKRKQLFAEALQKDGIPLKEGVVPFLQFCNQVGLKTVVATATAKENAVQYLQTTGILSYFTDIIGGNQITIGKPFPAIYETAANAILCDASQCIAVEDSPNGILSAFYAGCKVVMIPDLSEPEEMLQPFLFSVQPSLIHMIPLLESELKQNG